MREFLAKIMTIATGSIVCVLAVVFALIQNTGPQPAGIAIEQSTESPGWDREIPSRLIHDRINIELGRTIYVTLKCRTCHSIAGEGNRRNPLDGAGKRLDEEEIRQWVLAPGEIDPDIRKPDYTYLSQDQVDLLIRYIQSLK